MMTMMTMSTSKAKSTGHQRNDVCSFWNEELIWLINKKKRNRKIQQKTKKDMKQENSRIKKEDERKMKETSNSVHKERGNKYINAR